MASLHPVPSVGLVVWRGSDVLLIKRGKQHGQGQGVTCLSDLGRCWRYFSQTLGQCVKVQSGATDNDRALWAV